MLLGANDKVLPADTSNGTHVVRSMFETQRINGGKSRKSKTGKKGKYGKKSNKKVSRRNRTKRNDRK